MPGLRAGLNCIYLYRMQINTLGGKKPKCAEGFTFNFYFLDHIQGGGGHWNWESTTCNRKEMKEWQ